jgi:photosystem II stability/assembly factor-like uncharacterized protein
MGRSRTLVAVVGALLTLGLATGSAQAGRAAGLRFHAQSQSWATPQHGWLLGSVACGSAQCTTTLRTVDGGTTWKTLGSLSAPLTNEDPTGLTELRFADDLHGWAYGPALWATNDGGASWRAQALPNGRPVIALAADAQVAYAVGSSCDFNQGLTDCRRGMTLWRTTPGAASWVQVSLRLPIGIAASLTLRGTVAYLAIPTPGSKAADAVFATVDGLNWAARPDPCSAADGEYLSSVAPVSDTQVALLCQGDIGFGYAHKVVWRSNDNARTISDAGTLPQYGIVSELTATPNGTLLVSSFSIGSWIYRNGGGQAWTTSEDLGDGGIGWNDIRFTTDQVGFVIHGPAFCCGQHGPGELWKSTDAGLTWHQVEVAPQP